MSHVVSLYILIELGILVFAAISFLFWDKRYHKNHGPYIPAGFERTNEVSIDPKTAKRLRVYYNPTTGGRFYYEEG
jgi:hypothetical protein